MNEQTQALQLRVLQEQLAIFGVTGVWHTNGEEREVLGLLSLAEGAIDVTSKTNSARPTLDVASVTAIFAMETAQVPGVQGDRLTIGDKTYLVLPFEHRTGNAVQTHVPLRPWAKDANWR